MNNTSFTWNDIPHEVQHSIGALGIFITSFSVIKLFSLHYLDLLFATSLPIMYFAGREFRDYEKSGNMDTWGLLAPVILSLTLGGTCMIFRIIKKLKNKNLNIIELVLFCKCE